MDYASVRCRTLGALLDDTGRDLLPTLWSVFDESSSVRRTATALSIHENTVRYRLGRVEDLTDLEVASDSADQLTAQTSLLLLQLSGRCPWQLRVTDGEEFKQKADLRAIAAASG